MAGFAISEKLGHIYHSAVGKQGNTFHIIL